MLKHGLTLGYVGLFDALGMEQKVWHLKEEEESWCCTHFMSQNREKSEKSGNCVNSAASLLHTFIRFCGGGWLYATNEKYIGSFIDICCTSAIYLVMLYVMFDWMSFHYKTEPTSHTYDDKTSVPILDLWTVGSILWYFLLPPFLQFYYLHWYKSNHLDLDGVQTWRTIKFCAHGNQQVDTFTEQDK